MSFPNKKHTIFSDTAVFESIDEEVDFRLATLTTKDNFDQYFTEDVEKINLCSQY